MSGTPGGGPSDGWAPPATLLLAVLAVAALALGPAVATASERPLAAAGLDQTVSQGETVYLDASASRDPDGGSLGFSWQITAPDGTAVTPTCSACARPRFVASQTGRYEAMVTVTDDDGERRTDTLYVDVRTSDGPAVSLAGPDTTQPGDVPVTAEASAGTVPLGGVVWFANGAERNRTLVGGASATEETELNLTTGIWNVTAMVYDGVGHTDIATSEIEVWPNQSVVALPGGGGGGAGCGDLYSDCAGFQAILSDQYDAVGEWTPLLRNTDGGAFEMQTGVGNDAKTVEVLSANKWKDLSNDGTLNVQNLQNGNMKEYLNEAINIESGRSNRHRTFYVEEEVVEDEVGGNGGNDGTSGPSSSAPPTERSSFTERVISPSSAGGGGHTYEEVSNELKTVSGFP
jgi:hypothetical protein